MAMSATIRDRLIQTITATVIEEVIRAVVDIYIELYNLDGPDGINYGLCEDFAEDVCRLVSGAEAWWTNELDDTDFGMPKIIKYNGRYYDSECPNGVDNWRLLVR